MAESTSSTVIQQGSVLKTTDPHFLSRGVQEVVDYRGDVTLQLLDGSKVEGYVFSSTSVAFDIFPRNSPRAISVKFQDIESLIFSGEDTASGKSWEDWSKKKESERAQIRAQEISLTE